MKELVVKLRVDGSGVFPAFATLEKRANNLASGAFGNLKSAIAGAFAVGAIVAAGKRTLEWAGHLTDVATRLGVSTEWVQEMTYALKQSGASMEDLVSFTEKLNKARAEALSGSAAGQKISGILQTQFGVDATMLKGPVQPIIDAIAKSFESGNVQQLTAAMMKMGIKGAGTMTAAFADGLSDSRKQIRDAGGVVSEDVVEQLDMAGDQLQLIATIIQANLAPALVALGKGLIGVFNKLKENAAFLGGGTSEWSGTDWIKNAVAAIPRTVGDIAGNLAGQDTTSDEWASKRDSILSGGGALDPLGMFKGKKFDYAAASETGAQSAAESKAAEDAFMKAMKSRVARRNQSGLGEFEPPEGVEGKAAKRGKAETSDALVSVGNFLGNGSSAIEKIGNETNRLLRLIQQDLKNFKPSNKEYTDDLGIA